MRAHLSRNAPPSSVPRCLALLPPPSFAPRGIALLAPLYSPTPGPSTQPPPPPPHTRPHSPVPRYLPLAALLPRQPRLRPRLGHHILWSPAPAPAFRRSFISLFRKSEPQPKSIEIEPGWETAVQWRIADIDRVRPPSRRELTRALRDFFSYKCQYRVSVNDTQAALWRLVTRHLLDNAAAEPGPGLGLRELTLARDALLLLPEPKDDVSAHLTFSRDLYREITRLREAGASEEGGLAKDRGDYRPGRSASPVRGSAERDFELHLVALTRFGAAVEAAVVLAGRPGQAASAEPALWLLVLQGLAREGREEELCHQLEAALANGCTFDQKFHQVMVTFFARPSQNPATSSEKKCLGREEDQTGGEKDRIGKVKYWFGRPMAPPSSPTAAVYQAVLDFGTRTDQPQWLESVFAPLKAAVVPPPPSVCDVLVQWEYRSRARLDAVGALIEAMAPRVEQRADEEDRPHSWPSIDTYNALLTVAISNRAEADVKAVLNLTNKQKIAANTATYVLLLDWLLGENKVSKAHGMYQEMRSTLDPDPEDVAMTNRLVRALCDAAQPDFGAISAITDHLEERCVTLEPATLARVCQLYLEYDYHRDMVDLLAVNLVLLSNTSQQPVMDALLGYAFRPGQSSGRVWSTYVVLRQFFPDTNFDARRRFIRLFFTLHRADRAIRALQDMRSHDAPQCRPDADTYVEFFVLLGREREEDRQRGRPVQAAGEDVLRTAHDMLKLDVRIHPSTRLYNALMIAYTAAGRPGQALDYWADVTRSAEGPSYATLEAVFAACARKPGGDVPARKIWKRLTAMEVDVTPAVYGRYAAAVGSESRGVLEAMDLLERMEQRVGQGPDVATLGMVFNHLPEARFQREFASWARTKYPAAWHEVEKTTRRAMETVGTTPRWRCRTADVLNA